MCAGVISARRGATGDRAAAKACDNERRRRSGADKFDHSCSRSSPGGKSWRNDLAGGRLRYERGWCSSKPGAQLCIKKVVTYVGSKPKIKEGEKIKKKNGNRPVLVPQILSFQHVEWCLAQLREDTSCSLVCKLQSSAGRRASARPAAPSSLTHAYPAPPHIVPGDPRTPAAAGPTFSGSAGSRHPPTISPAALSPKPACIPGLGQVRTTTRPAHTRAPASGG